MHLPLRVRVACALIGLFALAGCLVLPMSDAELKDMGDELEAARARALAAGPPSGERSEEKVFDFHERIVRGCGNERIVEMLCGDLYHLLRIYRKRSGALPDRRTGAR